MWPTDGRWGKRVCELPVPTVPSCKGFWCLETFRRLCLWFLRKERPELFSSLSGFTKSLKPQGEKPKPFSQPGLNRPNPNQPNAVCLFYPGASSSARLERCRIGFMNQNPSEIWDNRVEGLHSVKRFFLPSSPPAAANTGHFARCQASAQLLSLGIREQNLPFTLSFKGAS